MHHHSKQIKVKGDIIEDSIKKENSRKILNKKENMKIKKYQENPKPRIEYEKQKYQKNSEQKENNDNNNNMPTMPNIKENMEKTNLRKIQVKFEYKKK